MDVPHVPHRRRPALPPEELRDGDLQAEPGRPHRLPQVERLVEGLQRGSFEAEREDEGLLFHVLQNLAMSRLILNTPDFTDFSKCQNSFLTNVLKSAGVDKIHRIFAGDAEVILGI